MKTSELKRAFSKAFNPYRIIIWNVNQKEGDKRSRKRTKRMRHGVSVSERHSGVLDQGSRGEAFHMLPHQVFCKTLSLMICLLLKNPERVCFIFPISREVQEIMTLTETWQEGQFLGVLMIKMLVTSLQWDPRAILWCHLQEARCLGWSWPQLLITELGILNKISMVIVQLIMQTVSWG